MRNKKADGAGEVARVRRQEQKYHYQHAALNALGLFGMIVGHTEMANDKTLEVISETSYDGLLHMIRQYGAYFDLDNKFEA